MTPALTRRVLLLSGAAHVSLAAQPAAAAPARPEPRRVLALFDGAIEQTLKETSVHALAAMPLEWLGLTLDYRDVRDGLPPIWDDPACRGVLTWFPEPNLAHYDIYVAWLERVAAGGRRIVQVGDAAPKPGSMAPEAEDRLRRRCFAALGIVAQGDWSAVTLGDRVVTTLPGGRDFEHSFDAGLPPFELYQPRQADAQSLLVLERNNRERSRSHVVVVTGAGGFVAPGYAVGIDPRSSVKRWSIDPFRFFAAAFAIDGMPAPDTTTLCGRRVFYSHVDGDGWRSLSQVRAPGLPPPTCAEVVLQQVIAANPDLPVTVAPIAAEMDPAFAGDLRAITAARKAFRLPNVEPATHTYTHPFRWSFFEHYSPAAERPFQPAYDSVAAGKSLTTEAAVEPAPGTCCVRARTDKLSPPRAFGGRGFDLNQEIAGSAALIDTIVPAGKRVRLLQWPGDCAPFDAALRQVAASGLLNINGGDTRCDDDFPSLTAVAAIGFQRNGAVQVYASNSSEELYTDLWTDRYYGFRDLPQTWRATAAPRRLKPMNLYYHMYSGERRASLDALLQNIAALRREGDFLAVFASRFADLAAGFFSARIEREGPSSWRVRDRGGLQTVRFADGERTMVDLSRSIGVLGERVLLGELYVALDPAEPSPLVALTDRHAGPPPRPVLVEASWEVNGLKSEGQGWRFGVQGFGPGTITWRVPTPGRWQFAASGTAAEATSNGDVLSVELAASAVDGLDVTMARLA